MNNYFEELRKRVEEAKEGTVFDLLQYYDTEFGAAGCDPITIGNKKTGPSDVLEIISELEKMDEYELYEWYAQVDALEDYKTILYESETKEEAENAIIKECWLELESYTDNGEELELIDSVKSEGLSLYAIFGDSFDDIPDDADAAVVELDDGSKINIPVDWN